MSTISSRVFGGDLFHLLLTLAMVLVAGRGLATDSNWESYALPQSMGLVGKQFYGVTLSATDVRSMDTMCKHHIAFFIMYGSAHGAIFPKNSPLLDRPEFEMARGVNFMHHYCYGEVERLRYYRESKAYERGRALKGWGGAIQYCINAADRDFLEWPFHYLLYTEMAEHYLHDGKIIQALALAQKSIGLKKQYGPAYVVASDALIKTNKKDEAIKILELGLKNVTETKALARRYTKLTGKQAPIEPKIEQASTPKIGEQPETALLVTTKNKITPSPLATSTTEVTLPKPENRKGESYQPEAVEKPSSGVPRFCRFCPD